MQNVTLPTVKARYHLNRLLVLRKGSSRRRAHCILTQTSTIIFLWTSVFPTIWNTWRYNVRKIKRFSNMAVDLRNRTPRRRSCRPHLCRETRWFYRQFAAAAHPSGYCQPSSSKPVTKTRAITKLLLR